MSLLPPLPQSVPFEEVADILDQAAMNARGSPPCLIPFAGWHLAKALGVAGFKVVRAPAGPQLTLYLLGSSAWPHKPQIASAGCIRCSIPAAVTSGWPYVMPAAMLRACRCVSC